MNIFLGLLLILTSLFLILLVLVQRGRGGGLTGALGGMGGQSAFGAKAGDVFTRVTIVTATIWILLCVVSVKVIGGGKQDQLSSELGANAPADESLKARDAQDKPAAGEKGSSSKPAAKGEASKDDAKPAAKDTGASDNTPASSSEPDKGGAGDGAKSK